MKNTDYQVISRKYEIEGVKVTIKPLYSMGYFEGYTAAAGNTSHSYLSCYNRSLFRYTQFGLNHADTAQNIAYDFIDYYYPATAKYNRD